MGKSNIAERFSIDSFAFPIENIDDDRNVWDYSRWLTIRPPFKVTYVTRFEVWIPAIILSKTSTYTWMTICESFSVFSHSFRGEFEFFSRGNRCVDSTYANGSNLNLYKGAGFTRVRNSKCVVKCYVCWKTCMIFFTMNIYYFGCCLQ